MIKTFNTKEACPFANIMRTPLRLIFQNSLVNGEFPHCSKQAEVIPVFKKDKNLTNPIIDV